MLKLIAAIFLCICLYQTSTLNDIAGKWRVDRVDISSLMQQIPASRKKMIQEGVEKLFLNAVFNFKSNHRFYLSPAIKSMPVNNRWSYDSVSETIKIEQADQKGVIMNIKIIKNNDGIYFQTLQATPLIFKVHKVSDRSTPRS